MMIPCTQHTRPAHVTLGSQPKEQSQDHGGQCPTRLQSNTCSLDSLCVSAGMSGPTDDVRPEREAEDHTCGVPTVAGQVPTR